MYIYLPQMHKLSFGGTFSITPLQQFLLQHRFNNISTSFLQQCLLQHWFHIAFATSSSTTSFSTSFLQHHLQHRFCNTIFYSIASTPCLQDRLLQHHLNTTSALLILQQHLITLSCYNNMKLLCCSNIWFLITPNHLTTPLATLKFRLQQCSLPLRNYNDKV